MFENYKNLIQTLFNNIFHNGDTPVSFLQYLQVIGMSLLLMLLLIIGISFIISIFILPKKCIIWLTRNITSEINKELSPEKTDTDFAKVFQLEKKLKSRKIFGCLGIILIYIPIGIPTILFIMDLLTRAL